LKEQKAAVLVAGSWGTALAGVLADNGYKVALWSRNETQVAEMNTSRRNRSMQLSPRITATSSMKEALSGANAAVIAATSAAMREVVAQMRPYMHPQMLLVHATKGFEAETWKRMSVVMSEELSSYDADRIVVLSGPSHAEEVARQCPTTVVVASRNHEAAKAAQELLGTSYFRVYTNPDLVGVEVSGALKNIIALGAGLSDGLGFGDNAKAALLTRGLAEIARLGVAMDASPLTFAGLAGVGDLIVTCTSKLSRNWKAGYLLAQGKTLAEALQEVGMVVEGVRTTQAAMQLSRLYEVAMPITEELHNVLFSDKPARTAVEHLMGRDPTREMEQTAIPGMTKWL
jgi:glycerol-3-phosphate dehydrogenase (NAD(P)+)